MFNSNIEFLTNGGTIEVHHIQSIIREQFLEIVLIEFVTKRVDFLCQMNDDSSKNDLILIFQPLSESLNQPLTQITLIDRQGWTVFGAVKISKYSVKFTLVRSETLEKINEY